MNHADNSFLSLGLQVLAAFGVILVGWAVSTRRAKRRSQTDVRVTPGPTSNGASSERSGTDQH